MTSPWDDVRRESIEMPIIRHARPSPLPWMLLTVSLALTIGVLWAGRNRLEDERSRTASALKANDELRSRVKSLEEQLETLRGSPTPDRDRKVIALELEVRRLQDELSKARAKE